MFEISICQSLYLISCLHAIEYMHHCVLKVSPILNLCVNLLGIFLDMEYSSLRLQVSCIPFVTEYPNR